MPTPTFSLGVEACISANPFEPLVLAVPDSSATLGAMQQAMATNLPVQCRGPDGALHYYVFDAERSTPSNPVMIFVGP